MKVKSESEVTQLCPTLVTPWTAAYQAPSSMGFSRIQISKVCPLTKTELNQKSATTEMTSHQNFWKLSITHRSYEKEMTKEIRKYLDLNEI